MQRIKLFSHRNNTSETQKGFTIVEITVVIVLLGILFPILSVFLVNMYRDAFFLNDKVAMSTDTTQGLWYMEDTIRNSAKFLATVPSPFTDPYGPHDLGTAGAQAWSYKGDSATQRVLITRNYSTTTNEFNNGRKPVFVNTPEFNCTTQMSYQPQLTYLNIFYTKDNTLYKRILTDTTTSLCAGNTQQQRQTCPPYIAVGSRHSTCMANDEVIASNVSNFTVAYYQVTQAGASVQIDPTYTSNNPQILASVDYATVTITTSARAGQVTNTMTQRMTKVNQ